MRGRELPAEPAKTTGPVALPNGQQFQPGLHAAGLRFGNALGHVGYTDAILVDALGRRSTMRTSYADGTITLNASAATLAAAAFPVTVDPVVTTFTAATSTTYVLTDPDVAFSNTSGHYLVVWTRVFSATDTDLHAVSVDTTGAVVAGSSSLIDNSLDRRDGGRVAVCGGNFLGVASRLPLGGGTRAIWGRVRAVGAPYTMGCKGCELSRRARIRRRRSVVMELTSPRPSSPGSPGQHHRRRPLLAARSAAQPWLPGRRPRWAPSSRSAPPSPETRSAPTWAASSTGP